MSFIRKSVALFKRGWVEIPDIMGGTAHFLFALGVAAAAIYIYEKNDGDNRKHKRHYTVIRHDDPRVPTVKSGPNVR